MKINVTISNGLTIEAEKNDGFIPSSVVGINTLELFFIEENYKGVVYKSMIRVPLLSEYLNDQDVPVSYTHLSKGDSPIKKTVQQCKVCLKDNGRPRH